MAAAATIARPHDSHSRRRPFANWMKRLASLKGSSSDSNASGNSKHTNGLSISRSRAKKAVAIKNNPYPALGRMNGEGPGQNAHSFDTHPSGRSLSYASPSPSRQSLPDSSYGNPSHARGNKSAAPTLSTNPETTQSETAQSKAGTVTTAGGAVSSHGAGGEGSTFSSPAPSVRSLTTTLTTIQSAAPAHIIGAGNAHTQAAQASAPTHFSHQFPASSPASAIPSHVVGHATSGGHPATYNMATANNLLTDNASILTLASSSKRRRRNSLDTNASVRALAPSSIFGGSRESLPLSVLSATVGDQGNLAAHHGRPAAGLPNNERASVYSSAGIGPVLSSERNSYYAAKQPNPGDGGSVRSGQVGHGRNDSITGSIGGMASAGSPLASPKEMPGTGRVSRRNSGWGEVDEAKDEDGDDETPGKDGDPGKDKADK